jgi:small-conductance mechanosensitive channel
MVWSTVSRILIPLGILLASLLAGWIFQRLVSVKLRKIAQKTFFNWDDILVESLKGLVFVWFLLAGMAIALKTIPLVPETRHLFHRFIALTGIFSGILFFARFALGLVSLYMDRVTGVPTTIFKNVTAIIVYLLGFLIVLDYLGISITPIITALGVGGLAMALALQDTLSNLFAGIHILITKKIKPGDYIKIESGDEGYVKDISWRNTTLKALPNNMIIVPNNKLAQSVVTNFHLPEKEMAVLVDVGVSYDSNLQHVEEITKNAAREIMKTIPGGIPEFEPFIRYHTFGDSSINFTVILRGQEFVDQFLIKHEFVKKLQARFREEGIEIPFPIRTVYLQKKGD